MQTLKPCPFCGGKAHYTKEIVSAGLAAVVMCSDNDCCTNHAETLQKAIDLWNTRSGTLIDEGATRPAAPVEGLETVAWMDVNGRLYRRIDVRPGNGEPLVSQDKAEAIIARERADYEEVLADKRRLTRLLDVAMHGEEGAAKQASLCDLIEPAKRLKADNAALTARVKELQRVETELCTSMGLTETQLAAAKKVLGEIDRKAQAGLCAGTFQGARNQYLLIRLDGETHEPFPYHPTWELTYLEASHDQAI